MEERNRARAKELELYVKCLNILNPIGHRNLMLVPLGGEAIKEVEYLLVSDAIRDGLLKVEETSKSGSVNELKVTSVADKMILMLDGEELVGAKQNRIMNTTVLLAAKSKTKIPVSCVEQGRWFPRTLNFASGSCSSPHMLAEKSRSVMRSLQSIILSIDQ